MSIKRGQAPKKIPANLSFSGPAEKFQLGLVFVNRKAADVDEVLQAGKSVAELVLFLVDSWETDYPLSVEGIAELDDDHPGVAEGIVQGYYQSRRVELAKN